MIKDYKTYITPKYVSIWIGNLKSEIDLDIYLQDQFPKDFGIKIDTQRIGEIWAETHPIDIYDLVKDFSRAKTFAKECVEVANKKGIKKANCMFIAYDLKFDEQIVINKDAPLRFLASLGYSGSI